ncbi:MAG: alkaline phosphatase [Candidatus Auribacterota bacterium]|jgi:alkaline phosphatase|nr:alkaline phosphatase [Candidatus Auribacterota bacterium]
MKRLFFNVVFLFVILMSPATATDDTECAILSLTQDAGEPDWHTVTFTGNSHTNYTVHWKDTIDKDSPWNDLHYFAIQEDLFFNANGTVKWIDRGIDPRMNGKTPGDVPQRFYKVSAKLPSAKYIILVIGDGMHLQHEIAASRYRYGTDYGMIWHSFPHSAYVTTWDVDTYNRYAMRAEVAEYDEQTFISSIGYDVTSGGIAPYPVDRSGSESYFLTKIKGYGTNTYYPATDSASSATAMSTGRKTNEGNISWIYNDPDNGAIETIAVQMRSQKGASIGIVSTMPFSHATPAAFVSNNKSRENYYTGYKDYEGLGIADQIITEVKPDIVISGGHPILNNPTWDTTKGFLSQSLYTTLSASEEYIFAERQSGVDGATTIQVAAQNAVAQNKKLFGLFGGVKGYFEPQLARDIPGAPSVVRSTIENPTLADSALAALTVAATDNDGFFLMIEQGDIDTANHYNNFQWMIASMWDLEEAVKTIVAYVDRPDDDIDWSNTLLIVTSDHANSYMRLSENPLLQKGDLPLQQGSSDSYVYPDGEVSYRIGDHTNELVCLYAMGDAGKLLNEHKGTLYPDTQIIDNTHIYRILRKAARIDD